MPGGFFFAKKKFFPEQVETGTRHNHYTCCYKRYVFHRGISKITIQSVCLLNE
jgi:hypothetical protein